MKRRALAQMHIIVETSSCFCNGVKVIGAFVTRKKALGYIRKNWNPKGRPYLNIYTFIPNKTKWYLPWMKEH
jgi:hypothetical protein